MDTNARFFVFTPNDGHNKPGLEGYADRADALAAMQDMISEGVEGLRLIAGRELAWTQGGVQIVRQRRERKPATATAAKAARKAKATPIEGVKGASRAPALRKDGQPRAKPGRKPGKAAAPAAPANGMSEQKPEAGTGGAAA